jgi:hypothetical protein
VCVGVLALPPQTAVASARTASAFQCTIQAGTKQVAELLAHLSSNDENGVRKLIARPSSGTDGLELAPTFEAFANGRSASYQSSLQVHTASDSEPSCAPSRDTRFEW